MSNVVRWLAPDLLAQPEPALEQEDAFELTEPDPEHEPEPPLQLPTLEEIQAIQDSAEKGFSPTEASPASSTPKRCTTPTKELAPSR